VRSPAAAPASGYALGPLICQPGPMPREGYIKELREVVGTRPLLLPSVAALIRRDDRVLVGKHHDTQRWVIPGGAVEPDESPADCTVREVWEETRLHVEIAGIRGVFGGTPDHRVVYPNGDVCDYFVTVFDVDIVGGQVTPTEELTELMWVTEEELAGLSTLSWMSVLLAHPHGWEPVTWSPPAGA
jgi:8-oxo-dGTP pyrophosphatase MutT (NUDIX family)